jgi:hypothetical protein
MLETIYCVGFEMLETIYCVGFARLSRSLMLA